MHTVPSFLIRQNSAVPPPSSVKSPPQWTPAVGCFGAAIVSCLSCPFLSSDSSLGFEGKAEGESCNVTAEWAPAPLACQGEGRGAAELRTYRDRRKALWPPREDQDLLCLVLTFGGRWAPPLAGRGDNNSTKYWGSGCSGQQAGQAAIISRAVSDSRCIA